MTKGRQKASMRACAAFGIALGAASTAGLWAAGAGAQTKSAPGPFTDAQAQAGQVLYNSRCASCHDAGGETIRLVGAGFTDTWKTRSTRDLYTRIKTTMPFNDPGSLSDGDAASVVAYVLKANGGVAGSADLTPATAVAINIILP